jgi:hypothetical protein
MLLLKSLNPSVYHSKTRNLILVFEAFVGVFVGSIFGQVPWYFEKGDVERPQTWAPDYLVIDELCK